MDLKTIEQIGMLLCEGIHVMKKLGISHPLLDKSDEMCKAVLPDLDTMSLADSAKLAQAAYDAIKRVHGTISP